MPVVYPTSPQTLGGPSPALDALRQLGSANPASSQRPNPNRLTEIWPREFNTPHSTPPAEVPILDQILESLKRAYPPNVIKLEQ